LCGWFFACIRLICLHNQFTQLAAGADKEAELHDGGTALNIASQQGHLAVAEALQGV
jgi:hypothetical protein